MKEAEEREREVEREKGDGFWWEEGFSEKDLAGNVPSKKKYVFFLLVGF